jgi:hypothetical protein
LNGILPLSVKKLKLAKSYWNAPLASFVPTVNSQQIQNIFDEKILAAMTIEKSVIRFGS